jgi:hypothetical protein
MVEIGSNRACNGIILWGSRIVEKKSQGKASPDKY